MLVLLVCLPTDSDVARGSYNIQQVQVAFAHAYHVLCNAMRSDDTGPGKTTEHFLCTNSILSCIICMPHQDDLPDDCDNFSRRKSTSRNRKLSHQKQATPHKKHKLNITRWSMALNNTYIKLFVGSFTMHVVTNYMYYGRLSICTLSCYVYCSLLETLNQQLRVLLYKYPLACTSLSVCLIAVIVIVQSDL